MEYPKVIRLEFRRGFGHSRISASLIVRPRYFLRLEAKQKVALNQINDVDLNRYNFSHTHTLPVDTH